MKLLFCPLCRDVRGLHYAEWRKCLCGESGGQYNEDNVTATIGGAARVFGIANPFFNELFPILETWQVEIVRKKWGYDDRRGECWWGEFGGDQQIMRIPSADGPRLVVRKDDGRVIIEDERTDYTIDGKTGVKEVHV